MTARYVLVTPARNEEKYIEKTICSVISQKILPAKWIIVSDGSTDKTDDIVKKYADDYTFIQLLRRSPNSSRNFGSKVFAIQAGVDCLQDLEYDFIGVMDADISFEPDFFESVIINLQANSKIGIGGGVVHERNSEGEWEPFTGSFEWSVSGAMQMFKSACYESIGGYLPLQRGGIDMIAEVMSRMHGWKVRTFESIRLFHNRTMGTATKSVLEASFRRGIMEYVNGYHPLIQMLRFFTCIPSSPFLLLSLFRTVGYYWALLKKEPMAVPDNVVKYLRKEQLQRLRNSPLFPMIKSKIV